MGDPTAYFVQFPHPGGEHKSSSDHMPWNTGKHGRKFLLAPGRYVTPQDGCEEADLVFWGEWEAPSRVEQCWPAEGLLPRFLYRPYWTELTTEGFRQNTDPWVWGESMLYSNCKQPTTPSLQRLTPRSVICFGSTIQGQFCVDTVFVVASSEPWIPAEASGLDVDEAFKVCTAEAITTNEGDAHLSLTLYRGASFDQPVKGMFSFVPARRADDTDPRFARPPVALPRLINPQSRQSTKGSSEPRSLDEIKGAWERLRQHVFAAGLVLGVHLETPDRDGDAEASVPMTGRDRC